MPNPPVRLLLITDSKRFSNWQNMLDCIAHAIDGGVDTVVLREKHLDSAKLLALASELRVLTRAHPARLMIHSQADIVKAVEADGVHVDAASIANIAAIKAWLDADMLVSASCHDANELHAAAKQGADFVFLSPVFSTQSHPGAPTLGAKKFCQLAKTVNIPVIALGGITPEVLPQLQGHGVAVMGTILNAKDPGSKAKSLLLP